MVRKAALGAGIFLLLLLIFLLSFSKTGNPEVELQTQGDLDGDGVIEKYVWNSQALTVTEGTKVLWKSPQGYGIDRVVLADPDNDGTDNVVVSLWKKGSFGKMRPFWYTGQNDEYKNHLFVYKLQDKTLKPVWCSSNLAHPILSIDIRDVDGDGLNELIVQEGQYKKLTGNRYIVDPEGSARTTVWQWQEWGFYADDRRKN
ncbi:hypothetical protein [Aminipila luticellarii]|uniref:FG-GAP repeat protein n=1 Tax=Aminipila luticellarii TaxID=2507160 RepID=A0A410PSD4_9FIRM|nr:hypothetical protein [Aminipila luticellarii]QAT41830.1 hypothetical protein EQM06_00545 [Aminipila luticellarii]